MIQNVDFKQYEISLLIYYWFDRFAKLFQTIFIWLFLKFLIKINLQEKQYYRKTCLLCFKIHWNPIHVADVENTLESTTLRGTVWDGCETSARCWRTKWLRMEVKTTFHFTWIRALAPSCIGGGRYEGRHRVSHQDHGAASGTQSWVAQS